MKNSTLTLLVSASLLTLGQAQAEEYGGFVRDSRGAPVGTGYGTCLIYGKPKTAACPGEMQKAPPKPAPAPVVKAEPKPAPAPAPVAPPAPAPVVTPKPAPAPVVVEAPAPKEEVMPRVIRLEGVKFKTNSDRLTASSASVLDEAAQTLKENPDVKVQVAGHTDSAGNDQYNMQLSQKRAEMVRMYLVGKGVNAGRITAKGYGETDPIASNITSEGRAQNRRVELRILE